MRPQRLRSLALAGGLVTAGIVSAQPPVFRSGVDLVTVDTLVVDANGRPVTGLAAADFELLVDGTPRPVESVEFLEFDSFETKASRPPVPEISANDAVASGRLVLVVVDRTHIRLGEGRQAMEAVAGLVRGLSPQDRVGLFVLPEGGPRIDPTSNHERVLAALRRVRGLEERMSDPQLTLTIAEALRIESGDGRTTQQATERNCLGISARVNSEPETRSGRIPYAPPTPERGRFVEQCQNRVLQQAQLLASLARSSAAATVEALEHLIEAFRYTEGPKTIVFVSEGMASTSDLRARLRELGSSAAASSIALYAVQLYVPPMDVTQTSVRPDWNEDRAVRAEPLAEITATSGGALFRPAASGDAVFSRIAREISARYVLGFSVRPEERDAKAHRIEVRVRSGARVVRHRTEFTLPPTPPRFANTIDTLPAALTAPLPIRALPVRVATYLVPEQGSEVKVILSAELGRADDPIRRADVAFEVANADGAVVARAEDRVASQTSDGRGLPYTTALRLSPGRYWLKLAAKDGSGRIGSIDHSLLVDPGGTLDVALGSLMLFRTVRQGETTRPELVFDLSTRDDGFGAHVIAHARTPSVLDELTAVLEVTDVGEQVSRYNRTMTIQAGASPAQRGFEAAIPTRHWPPGDYSAQVKVLRAGQPIATVTRALTLLDAGGPVEEGSETSAVRPARLGSLLERATTYVAGYAERVTSAVAEERYVQAILAEVAGRPLSKRDEVLAWREDQSRARDKSPGVSARRQLRSDLLMVRTSTGWYTNYRDVAEVDGKPVRERDQRALSLFTSDAAANGATLRRVALEGARHNLGTLRRTINVPTLPLFAVHPQHMKRFAFEHAGEDVVDGVPVTIVRFRERHIPTFIQNARGDDVFTRGRLWVAADGRVLKTALALDERSSGMQVTIDVAYRDVPSLGLLMPAEMHERYKVPSDPDRVLEGRAVYTNFREFTVTTEESR